MNPQLLPPPDFAEARLRFRPLLFAVGILALFFVGLTLLQLSSPTGGSTTFVSAPPME